VFSQAPSPSNVVYAQCHGQGRRLWIRRCGLSSLARVVQACWSSVIANRAHDILTLTESETSRSSKLDHSQQWQVASGSVTSPDLKELWAVQRAVRTNTRLSECEYTDATRHPWRSEAEPWYLASEHRLAHPVARASTLRAGRPTHGFCHHQSATESFGFDECATR